DALEAVLRDKPITALFTGHVHNAIVTTFAGHPVLGAPGIRSTVPLPFEPQPATGTVVDASSHPGLVLHVLADGKALQTVYRYPVVPCAPSASGPSAASSPLSSRARMRRARATRARRTRGSCSRRRSAMLLPTSRLGTRSS